MAVRKTPVRKLSLVIIVGAALVLAGCASGHRRRYADCQVEPADSRVCGPDRHGVWRCHEFKHDH